LPLRISGKLGYSRCYSRSSVGFEGRNLFLSDRKRRHSRRMCLMVALVLQRSHCGFVCLLVICSRVSLEWKR